VRRALAALLLCWPILAPHPAHAWGDEGHEIIATIADALMTPAARRQVHAMLATDDDPLTEHDMAAEATWADHLRSANADGARSRTRQWHFVDIELHSPSLDAACFGHPKLPPAALASLGPAQACIVDKIDQFATELARADTPPDERLAALKFLLHFVGDVHQPLHAADDDDRGGNDKPVSADGMRAGNLHHYWDTECVRALGQGPREIAAELVQHITPAEIARYSGGSAARWALESHQIAVRDAYGRLPLPGRRGGYRLSPAYIDASLRDCRTQLTKAGIRLAGLLDQTFARPRRPEASPKR